eukprot:3025520-Pyramimonas_sp.AAC.1
MAPARSFPSTPRPGNPRRFLDTGQFRQACLQVIPSARQGRSHRRHPGIAQTGRHHPHQGAQRQ